MASAAHEAVRHGEAARALELYREAAKAEVEALFALSPNKPRTLGITAVSAVALWYKAGDLEEAERLAHQVSAMDALPAFALSELRELLQTIWNERAQKEAGISFVPGQVVVSVKGGRVVKGGAPLDLILDKVQNVQNLFYRTAEFLKSLPLRKAGLPAKELRERCQPWLFQSVPGSYQFAVAIQKPPQGELFPGNELRPEALTDTFLSILKAAVEDPEEQLRTIVPNDDYRRTFLKMTRNLAPTGKVFDELEIRGSGDRQPVILSPNSRRLISQSLRTNAGGATADGAVEVTLQGILRALNLDQDWLEIRVAGSNKVVRGVGETVDDVIGPMVNHEVMVRAWQEKNGALKFIDIEQEE